MIEHNNSMIIFDVDNIFSGDNYPPITEYIRSLSTNISLSSISPSMDDDKIDDECDELFVSEEDGFDLCDKISTICQSTPKFRQIQSEKRFTKEPSYISCASQTKAPHLRIIVSSI